MGDRVTCGLTLFGNFPGQKADTFFQILRLNDEEGEVKKEDFLKGESCKFLFWDVNYAEMPQDLKSFLEENNVGYSWDWDAGDDYPAGILVWNHHTRIEEEYTYANHEIHLPISDFSDPEKIKRALDLNNYITNTKMFIYNSNHELLEKMKEEQNG